MPKIICLLLVFFGAVIMSASIFVYGKTLKKYSGYLPAARNRVANKYIGILGLMVFFLMGYAATFFLIFDMEEIELPVYLVSIIFFFGAVFCFSVVFVQSELLNRLEMNAGELRTALDNADAGNAELTRVNNELIHTMNTLKDTQRQLIFSEKMSTLGRLMAGISHEINTPLGVIHASAQSMESILSHQFSALLEELRGFSDEEFRDYLRYLELAAANTKKNYSTSELRAFKREARAALAETKGFNNTVLDLLSRCALLDTETVASLRSCPDLECFQKILGAVSKTLVLVTSVDSIAASAERINKMIMSMKSFSHVSASNNKSSFNVVKSIETVLAIFTNQLKYDFAVQTDFEEVPDIDGYEDELNQVWSNLIQNAVHAMRDAGDAAGEPRENILSISVQNTVEGAVSVTVSDNGSGIPPEKLPEIFEPFYTTKPTGIGTGLGLSISKQIIEKHNGNISAKSEEGKGTSFIVTLPALRDLS